MNTLKFRVNGRRLYKSNRSYEYPIVKGSSNFLALQFTFSQEWDGVQKVISFNGGEDYQAIQDSAVLVPDEILAGDSFSFSIIGISGAAKLATNIVTLNRG